MLPAYFVLLDKSLLRALFIFTSTHVTLWFMAASEIITERWKLNRKGTLVPDIKMAA